MFCTRFGLKFAPMLLASCIGGCAPDSAELARQEMDAFQLNATQPVSGQSATDGASAEAEHSADMRTQSESQVPVKLSVGDPNCKEATGSTGASTFRAKYWLGIQSQPAPKALLDQLDLSCGLLVHHVIEGGPSTGLLQESDLITHFNGQELNCQKKLCSMITDTGLAPIKLTVIRKLRVMELEVQPQPFEVLSKDRILQYTVLADEVDADPTLGMPELSTPGFEKLRLFVVQPMLNVGGHETARDETARDETAAAETEQGSGQWQMVRVASFRFDENGRRILVVQEGGQVKEYNEDQLSTACDEIKKLIEWIDNGP